MINYSTRKIPMEWTIKRLSQVICFLDSKRVPIKEEIRQNRQGPYPYYGASGIIDYIDDYIFDEDLILLAEDGANILARSTPIAFKATGKYWVNNHAHILKPRSNSDIDYLIYYLESLSYHKFNSGAAQPKLNLEVCASIPVVYPPLPEQKAIAGLLSSWDEAIEKIERLIQAKEKRFKWLLRKLISEPQNTQKGIKRKNIKFSQIFKLCHKKNTSNKNFPVLSVTTGGIVFQSDYFNKEVASEDKTLYLIVEKGMFVMSGLNFWMGSADFQTLCEIGIVSPAYKVFSLVENSCIPQYMHFFVKSRQMMRLLERSSVQGASVVRRNLDMDALSNSQILLPSESKQKQISEALSLAQKEVACLKQLSEKYKTQKRGLMQKMLTGEWRIKIRNNKIMNVL